MNGLLRNSDILVICGSAQCLFEDLAEVQILVDLIFNPASERPQADVMCINHTALYYPYFFKHWVTYHKDIFKCERKYIKGDVITHSVGDDWGVDKVWQFERYHGTDSGLLAVKVAKALGYKKIILAGVPIDGTKRFFDPVGEVCHFDADNIRLGWDMEKREPDTQDRIRSLSGWTRELFGAPAAAWLRIGD